MELIQLVSIKSEKRGVSATFKDTRKRVDVLHGIAVPAYPFTLETFGKDMEELKEANGGFMDAEYLLDVCSDIGDTINRTRQQFQDAIAELYPTLSVSMAKGIEEELMLRYVSGVCGADAESFTKMSKDTQKKFYSERGFEEVFVLYRVKQLKVGHSAIKVMMLDNIIFPTCQSFTLTQDGRMYLIDCVNPDSYTPDEAGLIDVTEDVLALMKAYDVITGDTRSLGDWLNSFPGAVQVLADNLAYILFGYTENDAIKINTVKTARQHMAEIARVALQKHTQNKATAQQEHVLAMAQMVADDELKRQALVQAVAAQAF